MARVKLTEYRAKQLLSAAPCSVELRLETLADDLTRLAPDEHYIVKVDQGIKKRGKQGLIRLDVAAKSVETAVRELADQGFERFIAEPMVAHEQSEEQYLSIERVRDGVRILHSPIGGVDIESQPDAVTQYDTPQDTPLPMSFLQRIIEVMDTEQLTFVEINPLVVRGDTVQLLDAAVLADSAGSWRASWTEADIVDTRQKTPAEQTITELNEASPASFSFRVLNPDGAVWLLLSGGGASITIADEAANRGRADIIGNYGEYSGGPTREETQLYTEAVLTQLLASKAPRRALVIAGGVANFTDVKKTFAGIIDSLRAHLDELTAANVKVYVRRGGPNEAEGLAQMTAFLKQHDMYGSVHGSDAVLTVVVDEALEYIDA